MKQQWLGKYDDLYNQRVDKLCSNGLNRKLPKEFAFDKKQKKLTTMDISHISH